jgi:hypothetical protein
MAFEDEILDAAKEDIANKYAKQQRERDRQTRNHFGLSGSSLTSAINPFNLARQREFLAALAASRDMRRQDEDLALRRSGQEHQQRLAENTLAEQKRQAQAKEEQARQQFGLNRDIVENTKLDQRRNRVLETKQAILNNELANKKISIDAFVASTHADMQREGLNITKAQLKQALQNDPYITELSRAEMINKIENDIRSGLLTGRQVDIAERAQTGREQEQRMAHALAPETQQAASLRDQREQARDRSETAEARANYAAQQSMQNLIDQRDALNQEIARRQAMGNNISGVGNVLHMGKAMGRAASTTTGTTGTTGTTATTGTKK